MLIALSVLTAGSQSDLTLLRTIDLQGETHHVQGIDFDNDRVWITFVDKEQRRGYLQEFSLDTGKSLRTIDAQSAIAFIPEAFPLMESHSGCLSQSIDATAAALSRKLRHVL